LQNEQISESISYDEIIGHVCVGSAQIKGHFAPVCYNKPQFVEHSETMANY